MKKKSFKSRLNLKKHKISNLNATHITGGNSVRESCFDSYCNVCPTETLGPLQCPPPPPVSLPNGTVGPCPIGIL